MITTVTTVSAAAALALVQSAAEAAAQQGLRVAVCVTDAHGETVAALRMDGVTPPIMGFATDKAYTAATMRRSTEAFADRMAGSKSLSLGLSNRARLLAWGGGLPIVHEGSVIGGIGVSGASDVEDIACAKAALSASGLGWEP